MNIFEREFNPEKKFMGPNIPKKIIEDYVKFKEERENERLEKEGRKYLYPQSEREEAMQGIFDEIAKKYIQRESVSGDEFNELVEKFQKAQKIERKEAENIQDFKKELSKEKIDEIVEKYGLFNEQKNEESYKIIEKAEEEIRNLSTLTLTRILLNSGLHIEKIYLNTGKNETTNIEYAISGELFNRPDCYESLVKAQIEGVMEGTTKKNKFEEDFKIMEDNPEKILKNLK